MTMKKSISLPGLMTLGANNRPRGLDVNYAKKPTLSFRLTHGAVDLYRGPGGASADALKAAELLRNPGWRQKAHADEEPNRPATPKAVEDLVPGNMRQPRVAPAWLKHDKQVLRFYGYFQEHVTERPDENSRYRQVSIMFYMEDGTLGMAEPKVENSGIPQGQFLKRHRVPREDGNGFIGPDDFRCGTTVTVYGRTYKITGCDRFTRWFYEENGIDVGEDEPMVEDKWQQSYKMTKMAERGQIPMSCQAMDSKTYGQFMVGQPPADLRMSQFLLNDRKVLRFKAYWDDHTLYGCRLYFVIHYYLADNTMEINEAHSRNSGRATWPVFFRRGPMYKRNAVNAYPGMLISDGGLYMPEDLRVGDSINVWGRKVVLYECDDFTQKFYKEYMDIDQAVNKIDVSEKPIRHVKLNPPPHNGIGSPEDSLINCQMIQPKPHKQDLAKMMVLSGENLRFEAKMVNGEPEDECRRFVIAYFPDTDRTAVYEIPVRNSGHMGGKFREKAKIMNPDTGKYFCLKDLYVGTTVNICSQPLQIIRADEHCLQFLESRPAEYPWADPVSCAQKLKSLAEEPEMHEEAGIDPDRLKEIAASHGVDLIDHEVITLLRAFGQDTPSGQPVVHGPTLLRAA
eukprot:CAMPEP_0206433662 /NCGR_PEP_ID=MMETSP0324_2-20121206/8661_1 /ASSEMBLY_ACC=CAM_ASM_000836 /TAXON_ID=2866 /ORGANISM="Crypthecodinium cohnii, Strain Seligo" /LENGTH=623 /DNA_ID=CAMNT_0053899959 /DNA_START=168 /DNA_END=2039 /DNA_ORIENTATION=+